MLPPAPRRHQHPDDGRKLHTCAIGVGPGPAFLQGQASVLCEDGAGGAAFSFASKKDGRWVRQVFSGVQLGEPQADKFKPPPGFRIQDAAPPVPHPDAVQRMVREALQALRALRGPSVQVRPGEPAPAPLGRLMNPRFTPGEQCDELRLVGAEQVIWQCAERAGPLLRTRRTG